MLVTDSRVAVRRSWEEASALFHHYSGELAYDSERGDVLVRGTVGTPRDQRCAGAGSDEAVSEGCPEALRLAGGSHLLPNLFFGGGFVERLAAEAGGWPDPAPHTCRELGLEAPLHDGLEAWLRFGVAVGELRSDANLDVVADLLVGPMFFRILVSGAEVTPELASETVDLVLRGISPR